MNEVLYALGGIAVLVVVGFIVLHSKMSAVHAAALAPVSVAIVPVAPAPPAAPAAPAPKPVNTTDPVAPGFEMPAQPAPPPPLEAPTWTPSPVMKFADCTGQNIPINTQTSYTITDCPAVTMVGTNATTLPCDPYVLTVNGVGTSNPIQTSQCTVYAKGDTISVSVAPATAGGIVNLIMQVHAAA